MSLNVKCLRLEEELEQTAEDNANGEPLPKEQRNIIVESDSFEGYIKNDRECLGFFSGESKMVKRPDFGSKHANNSGKIDYSVFSIIIFHSGQ